MKEDTTSLEYKAGYAAALIPPPEQPKNPHPEDTIEWYNWSAGYGDATEDYIRWQGGEFD